MIFPGLQFRDPITTPNSVSAGLNGGVTAQNPASNLVAVQRAPSVNGVPIVHTIPALLAVSTNQQLYSLPTANQAYLALRANPKRRGLTIINTNPLANIYIGFGGSFPINKCAPLAPGGANVMDTQATPQDDVWVTSDTANSVVLLLEFQNS